jgi:membrane protease YdiL (CAAX protease family)
MEILTTILMFVPFVFILWLVNLAYRKQGEGEVESAQVLKWISYGLVIALYLGIMLLGLMLQIVGLLATNIDPAALPAGPTMGIDRLPAFAVSLWAPALVGLLLLTWPVRRLFARFTPLDPDSPVQAVALSYSALVLINLLATLGIGLDNLAETLEQQAAAGINFNTLPLLWAQDITMVVLGLVGVGWLARRGLGSALNRLAIVRPTLRQIGIGLAAGLLMVPVVIGLEYLLGRMGIQANADVERLTEQLIGPLATSIPGILTLGLAAALGEETVFRGALQPRFGLIFTTLLFALLHSTYGVSVATLIVFGVGLVLGFLRMRYNTTTSMVAHAVYNMTLGLIAMLGVLK